MKKKFRFYSLIAFVSLVQVFSIAPTAGRDLVSSNAATPSHTRTCTVNGTTGTVNNSDNGHVSVTCIKKGTYPGTFSITGNLNRGRGAHSATLLPDGKVLIAGGREIDTAELYDPNTGLWSYTGNMMSVRFGHTATVLPNGKVLVAGGERWDNYNGRAILIVSAELYDPTTGAWSTAGNMITPRNEATATLLPNGKILVAGGTVEGGYDTSSTELYDPATDTWAPTGDMLGGGHAQTTATLLTTGKVLVTGGYGGSVDSELYDPATGVWAITGSKITPRYAHSATLLPNGKVLVSGGNSDLIGVNITSSAELYDPVMGTWTATGNMHTPRYAHSHALLTNGTVLSLGGSSDGQIILSSAEIYDPSTGAWILTSTMAYPRAGHTTTLLASGGVLVAGSEAWPSAETAEIYHY